MWAAVVWALGTGVLGALEPLLGAVGWCGCALAPFGVLEILLVQLARVADDPARASRRLARLQVASVVLGGLPSALVGLTVLRDLR
ncbi:MAG: hypothetical protein KC656_08550 [Myxococcales bacterium]|nr:hypothetical protein [Myxococcales bacterium]MCB9668453.1 hypothetical protein [Alphaproteobacteria bacterium]MCB9690691.1 hypothetical protein [Alphaproteobacteria bacterium]